MPGVGPDPKSTGKRLARSSGGWDNAPYSCSMNQQDVFYRLVTLTKEGLAGYDRHAYRSLGITFNAQKVAGEVGIARSDGVDSDIVVVNGEWIDNPRVGYPSTAPYNPCENGTQIADERLLRYTQPGEWFGRTFLDGVGTGLVWTGKEMLRVQQYRIVENGAGPEYEGLYAASIAATYYWWDTTGKSGQNGLTPAVICIDSAAGDRLRRNASIPFTTEYLMLLPSEFEGEWPANLYVSDQGAIRPPRHLVPVAERTLKALERLDIHEPRPQGTLYYRWTEVTPKGVVAADGNVYTNPTSCTNPPYQDQWESTRSWALCRTKGLPADAKRVDGRPVVTDAKRTRADYFDRIVRAHNMEPGKVIVDQNGDGMLYDGQTLRQVEKLKIREPGSAIDGQPAWIMSTLKRAGLTPGDVNIHGVLIPVTSQECQQVGLPGETRGVLFLREGQSRRKANAIPLTRAELNDLQKRSIIQFNPERLAGYQYSNRWQRDSRKGVPAGEARQPDGTATTWPPEEDPRSRDPEESARAAATETAQAAAVIAGDGPTTGNEEIVAPRELAVKDLLVLREDPTARPSSERPDAQLINGDPETGREDDEKA